jgi:uncharacterized BrkB/YihY/UPF0761 family membrane protein
MLLRQVTTDWIHHEGPRLAASLSFYTLLSLAPLVILTIVLTSFAFGRPAAQQAIIQEVAGLVGDDGARAVQTVITYGNTPQAADWASALGVLVLLFGASSVLANCSPRSTRSGKRTGVPATDCLPGSSRDCSPSRWCLRSAFFRWSPSCSVPP